MLIGHKDTTESLHKPLQPRSSLNSLPPERLTTQQSRRVWSVDNRLILSQLMPQAMQGSCYFLIESHRDPG